MLCKWCGMESTTVDRCSWCQGVLTLAGSPRTVETNAPEDAGERPEGAPTAPSSRHAAVFGTGPSPEGPPAKRPAPPAPAMPPRRRSSPVSRAPDAAALSSLEPATGLAAGVAASGKRGPAHPHLPAPSVPPGVAASGGAAGPAAQQSEIAAPQPPVSDPSRQAEAALLYGEQGGLADGLAVAPITQAATSAAEHGPPRGPEMTLPAALPPALPLAATARYAGALALLLLLAGAWSYASPSLYGLPLVAAQFLGALLLPVMGVAPWQDEDSDDIAWFFVLTVIGGPVVALIVYAFLSILRQSANPAILGCMIVATLTRVAVEAGRQLGIGAPLHFSMTQFSPYADVRGFTMTLLFVNWSGIVALVGWCTANVFHKFDE